jgi:sulfoxide reductase catalytic subunit YedY
VKTSSTRVPGQFVAHYADMGGGSGGYNEDHEFFGYRQSI